METQSRWWHHFIAPVTLTSITACGYSFSLNYDFQFDDFSTIRNHFALKNDTFWNLAFKTPRWISHWLNLQNYQLGGFEPFYYRTFNVAFHIGTGLLIFYIVRNAFLRLKKESYCKERANVIAFVTALLFLLHPVQTQTISYVIQGQLEGLAGFFVMSLILVFLKLTQAQTRVKKYSLTTLLFALSYIACGTKEIAILSPVMLLMIDWFFVAQGDMQDLKKRWALHLLLFGLVGLTYLTLFKSTVATTHAQQNIATPWGFFISQFQVIVHYILIFLWPFNISADYDWQMVSGFFTPNCLVPFGLLLCIFGGILWLLKKDKTDIIAFGALWFFIGLAPRSTFIPSTQLLADYKTYFSSFGGLLLLGIFLVRLFEWAKDQIAYTTCPSLMHHPYTGISLCALILGISTYQRNLVWRSQEAFWYDILQHSPLKARAHNNYGTALVEQERFEEALQSFKKETKLDTFYTDTWNNLAVTYEKMGKVDRAIETMKEALKVHPDSPEFYNNLGSFMLAKKEYAKVEPYCKKALELRPNYGKAYYNLAQAQLELGKIKEAWELFGNAIFKADFTVPAGFEAYAQASMKLEKFEEAIFGFEKVLKARPDDAEILFKTANAHYCNGTFERAETLYKKMAAIAPKDLRAWYNLGELYLKTKDAQTALPYFEKAAPLNEHIPSVGVRIAQCKTWANQEAQGKKVVIS